MKMKYYFLIITTIVVSFFLFGCANDTNAKNGFVGTEIIKENPSVNTDISNTNNTNQNNGNTAVSQNNGQIQNTSVIQNSSQSQNSQKPPIKSNSRLTSTQPDKLNLNEGDFSNFPQIVSSQTKNLSKQSLMLYDGYGTYLKEGNMATYKYDPDGDYENPKELVYSVVLRYETDYIDDFIKYKRFNITGKKTYNVSVGEYSVAYFEYPPNGVYQSIYTIEFVKYDIYVKVVVASKEWVVTSEDVAKYARKIEARIHK